MKSLITRDELVDAIVEEGLELKDPPEKLLELAERVADRFRLGVDVAPPIAATPVYDLVHEQDWIYPNGKRKAKLVGGKPVMRDPATITHFVFHQTAVEYGVSERQVKASGGDRELALARRFLDVACHVAVSRHGFYVFTHPLEALLWHGNGFNDFSIGMEIDGRYAGLEDDPATVAREDLQTTWRGSPTVLAQQTVETACAAVKDTVERGRALGMPLTHAVAHRQSSPTRRSDPGEAIWKRIVLDFAERELGMQVELDRVLDTRSGPGRPIPHAWDPRSSASY